MMRGLFGGVTFALVYHLVGLDRYSLWVAVAIGLMYGLGHGCVWVAYDRWCDRKSDESTS